MPRAVGTAPHCGAGGPTGPQALMGFPGGTVDVPGPPQPQLAAIIETALLDPYGHGERLVAALRGEVPLAAGHLATNAWVFDGHAEQVLLVRHRVLGWVNPGGHLDLGELPVVGAARELLEETGVTPAMAAARPGLVRAAVFPAGPSGPAHWHWNIHHLFVADPATPLTPEPGSPVAWFPVGALPDDRVSDLDELLALLLPLVPLVP
jgi:8-oxo-dGTP pyrophosphatase MutT (NUDIX family)